MNGVLGWMAMGSFLRERLPVGQLKEAIDRLATEDAQETLKKYSEAELETTARDPAFKKWGDRDKTMRALKVSHYFWCASWHNCGFPRVALGHKHAASLMATRTRHESIPDARAPWDAFLVDVPAGLLADGNSPYRITHVAFLGIGPRHMVIPMIGNGGGVGLFECGSVAELGDLEADTGGADFTLLARLVLGVCMEMTCTTYKGGLLRSQPVKRDPRTGEPKAWTFALTRDVKVDCREAVRAYSRGETHNSPSVQCLVRGHWKTQPCGKGGADRKNIFVEPYWRGPEDVPIALRKHAVKHPDDDAAPA